MARYDDDDDDRPVKKRRRKSSGDSSKLITSLITVLIALFVSGVMVVLSFFGFSGPIFWICLIAYFIAQGWILMIAAADDTTQLMLCLFVPFYAFIYTIMNWSETKWAFCLGVLATFTLFASVVAGVIHEAKEEAKRDRMDGVAHIDEEEEPWDDEEPPQDPAPRRPRRNTTPQQPPQPQQPQPKVTPQQPSTQPVAKKDEPKLDPLSLEAPYDVDPQAKTAGQKVYLTTLKPFAFQNSPWKLGIGAKGEEGMAPLQFNKQEYRYGVCMHPPMKHEGACRVSFVPGKEFKRFKGWVGISGETNPSGQVLFAAYGDGRRLWESESITKTAVWNRFDLDITNVKVLTLETRMKDGINTGAHAAWLDPWLER